MQHISRFIVTIDIVYLSALSKIIYTISQHAIYSTAYSTAIDGGFVIVHGDLFSKWVSLKMNF
ncbi:MAG: hypothetical protein LBP59_20635 [Planctomycetaceae bacterium]|nr:hypothetical protein [Planctomycetaceae bacterium]